MPLRRTVVKCYIRRTGGYIGNGQLTLLDALADELCDRGESVTTVLGFAEGPLSGFVSLTIGAGSAKQFRDRALTLTVRTLVEYDHAVVTHDYVDMLLDVLETEAAED